jgi:hypothetical protein
MDFLQGGWDGEDLHHLTSDRTQWRNLMTMGIEISDFLMASYF